MAQFYLLSILTNILGGLALSANYLGRKTAIFDGFKALHERKKSKMLLGLATAIAGVLKLIFKSPGETIPVAGDLLPAIVGIAIGLLLFSESIRREAGEDGPSVEQTAKRTIYSFATPLGIVGVIASFFHFILPGVVIL